MNWFDYLILIIIAGSIILGIVRGFVREMIILVSWIVAFAVASYFSPWLADKLVDSIALPGLRIGLCFFALLIVMLLIGIWFNHSAGNALVPEGMSAGNRSVGALFGFLRGVLLISFLLVLAQTTKLNTTTVWQESKLIPHFTFMTEGMNNIFNLQMQRYVTGVVDKVQHH